MGKEWRIVELWSKKDPCEEIKFRVRSLVPYVELALHRDPQAVRFTSKGDRARTACRTELGEEALEILRDKCGYSGVEIAKSKIPLRALCGAYRSSHGLRLKRSKTGPSPRHVLPLVARWAAQLFVSFHVLVGEESGLKISVYQLFVRNHSKVTASSNP